VISRMGRSGARAFADAMGAIILFRLALISKLRLTAV
jgi:hypothetical protein